jgi:hypothetical protein
MAFNRNFSRVSLGVDSMTGADALFVEGRSEPPDSAAIVVGVPRGAEIKQAPVLNPQDADWEARVPVGSESFKVGDDVFVFGVATRDAPHDPFVWHGSLRIEER